MKLHSIFRTLDAFYVFLLSIGVGCIMTSAFAAAAIFGAANSVPALSASDSGLIMGQIFLKCNNYFNFLAIVIIVYELAGFVFAKQFACSAQRRFWLLLGGINVILIFLFTRYYTPFIMEAQAQGTINNDAFSSMHKQSELVFKILLFTLSISALWRGIITTRPRS